MKFAKSINAVFHLTSAANNIGINDLFNDLGRKLLDTNDNSGNNSKGVKLNDKKGKDSKKCC